MELAGPAALWHIDLHHGAPDLAVGPGVIVITGAELPARGQQGATGVRDAAMKALGHLDGALTGPHRTNTQRRQLIELGLSLDDSLWVPATARVDGAPRALQRCRHDDLWVAAADLGPVAIARCGHGMRLETLDLRAVDDVLDMCETSPWPR